MNHMKDVRALRADTQTHYNCCQSVLVPFAVEMGLTREQAAALGAHFGSGMRHGATCGALSGALMVLGGLGYGEKETLEFIRTFRGHHGTTECSALLKAAHERGEARKDHCDGLVYEIVQALCKLHGVE